MTDKEATEALLCCVFGRKKEKTPISASPEQMADFLKKIQEVLDTLSNREQKIIRLRYGLAGGKVYTTKEVADILKETRKRVRQLEAKAILKLQHPVRNQKLRLALDALNS